MSLASLQAAVQRNEEGIDLALKILAQRFGERFSTSAAVREQHGHTTTWLPNQAPDGVVFARSTEEVADVVQVCAQHKVPIIPFGTGSSLEGHVNAPAGGISVDVSQMNRVLQVNAEDLDCVVEAGVTRTQLNEYLRDTGLFFPIDPGADASLGGMAATRASGTNAVRYGTMKDVVLALTVVTADGRIVRTGGRAKKTAAGYDLTRLMVGSEGTLGIITEVTLRLYGIPEAVSGGVCPFPDLESACNAVITTIQSGLPVARIELLDANQIRACNAYSKLELQETPTLFLEFHGTQAGVREQSEIFGEIARDSGGGEFVWATKGGRSHPALEGAARCLLGSARPAAGMQGRFDRCLRADLAAGGVHRRDLQGCGGQRPARPARRPCRRRQFPRPRAGRCRQSAGDRQD